MTKVTVIDTIMGAGKTSYMIEVMNRSYPERLFGGHDRRFIFVTLLLDEIERIKDQCSSRCMLAMLPSTSSQMNSRSTSHPMPQYGIYLCLALWTWKTF